MLVKNRRCLLFWLLLFVANITQAMCSTACNICSHTTFIPRVMAQNDVLELALHQYYTYRTPCCNECPPVMSVQLTAPYYFRSTNKKELAQYFLPQCNECITIAQNNTSDISSLWLNIAAPLNTPFSSSICLSPTRTVVGGAIRLFFDMRSWFNDDDCSFNNWWASVFIPIQRVTHDLNIVETPGALSGTPIVPPSFANGIDALNNPAWQYGKLSPKKLTKNGVDDICIRVGYDFVRDACQHAGLYALVFAPTGSGTKSEYLFEPLVGSKHVGLGLGFNADSLVYECGSNSVDLLLDVRWAHFFSRKEIRSIDLFNGDWSRYLNVVQQINGGDALLVSPGINNFTQEVDVRPGNFFEAWAAISFNHCDWHFEVGYDFWLRGKEKLKLADTDLGVGIQDIAANPQINCPTTAHCARICQAVPNQPDAPVSDFPEFITVKNSTSIQEQGVFADGNSCSGIQCALPNQCSYLNLDSAAHPRAFSSTVFAGISWTGCLCWCDTPAMVGIGGQYEFAHRHSALSQYGVWLKTAISF